MVQINITIATFGFSDKVMGFPFPVNAKNIQLKIDKILSSLCKMHIVIKTMPALTETDNQLFQAKDI